jgi:acetamidase/formamidase
MLENKGRREFLKFSLLTGAGAAVSAVFGGFETEAVAAVPKKTFKADYKVDATVNNLIKGALSPDKKPVLTVESGAIVDIETVSMLGIVGTFGDYTSKYGLDKKDPIIEKIAASEGIEKAPQGGGHVLTGPIYIKGAKPGDVLEVRVLENTLTTGFGNVMARPGAGGVPDVVKETFSYRINFNDTKTKGIYYDKEVVLNPFFGIMGLAPEQAVSSVPPGPFGGNMDIKALTVGTSLFLPVKVDGAMYYTGDAHAAQGDGEVSITAVETSLTGRVQFIVHKDMTLTMPMAETPDYYIATGMNKDLNLASRQAILESAAFIASRNGLTFNESLMLCSIGVDFKVAQVVNQVKGIYSAIPKSLITNRAETFWNADGSVKYA